MYIKIVRKVDNGFEEICTSKISCKNYQDFFKSEKSIIDNILKEKNIDLFEGNDVDTYQINRLYGCNGYYSSYHKEKGSDDGFIGNNTSVISSKINNDDTYIFENSVKIVKDNKISDSNIFIGVDLFDVGYVFSTGKTVTNLLGMTYDGYLSKFTSKNVRSSSKEYAKILMPTQMLAFIKKYKYHFEYLVSHNGWYWEIEPANKQTIDLIESYSSNKKEKIYSVLGEINKLLDEINCTERTEDKVVVKDTPENEALQRMVELNLYGPVVNGFKNGKLYQSEAGGIIYELDSIAQKAVEECKEHGLPYHIVKSGDLYSVLYVSKYKNDWNKEHYNKCDNYIPAYVYNASGPFLSEIGDIGVIPCNGGLKRIF